MSHQQQQPSREVLKWLQGLDLAYAIKNVRRDFANGFLVAEMFSRYFPKLITMHSFDNALRMAARQDNWRQLELIFAKIDFSVDNQTELIQSIMHSRPGASLQMINAAYTFLTAREICTQAAPSTLSAASLRARARERAKRARQAELGDSRTEESKDASEGTAADQQHQGSPRSQAPDRGADDPSASTTHGLSAGSTASSGKGPSKVLRGENRQLAKVASQVQVKASAVNIKSVDAGIMALRAARRHSQGGAFGSGPSVPGHEALIDESKMMDGSAAESKMGSSSVGATGGLHSPFGIVEEAVAAALGAKSGFSVANILADIDCLAPSSAASPMMSPAELESVVSALQAHSDALMSAALEVPEQWTQLAPRLATVLIQRDNRVAGQILADVGGMIAEEDSCTARAVYFGSILPVMQTSMEAALPQQRATAMAIYAAYCPPQDLIGQYEALRQLQRHLRRKQTLLACVVTLMNLAEGDLALQVGDPACRWLVGLAVEGFSHSAPSVRACALAILAGVLERVDAVDEVATPDLLFRASTLARDPWWEVRVQLGRVAIAARDYLLLREALRDPESLGEHAAKLACCLLAPVLSEDAALVPLFVSCAVQLSAHARREVLGTLPASDAGLGVFVNAPNAATQAAKHHVAAAHIWDPAALLDALTAPAPTRSGPGSLAYVPAKDMTAGEADLLAALLLCSLRTGPATSSLVGDEHDDAPEHIRGLWGKVYEAVGGALLRGIAVARADEETMDALANLVLVLCRRVGGLNVFAHPLWPDVLRKVYLTDASSSEEDPDTDTNQMQDQATEQARLTKRSGDRRSRKNLRPMAPGAAVLHDKLVSGITEEDSEVGVQDLCVSLEVLVEDAPDLAGDACQLIASILDANKTKSSSHK